MEPRKRENTQADGLINLRTAGSIPRQGLGLLPQPGSTRIQVAEALAIPGHGPPPRLLPKPRRQARGGVWDSKLSKEKIWPHKKGPRGHQVAALLAKPQVCPTFQRSGRPTLQGGAVCFAAIFILGCQSSPGCLFVWLPSLASLSSAFCESLWRPTQNIPFLLSPYPTRSRLLQLSSTYEKIGVKVFLANIHGKRRMFRGLKADEGLGWD